MKETFEETMKKYDKSLKRLSKSLKGLPLILRAMGEIEQTNFEHRLKELEQEKINE